MKTKTTIDLFSRNPVIACPIQRPLAEPEAWNRKSLKALWPFEGSSSPGQSVSGGEVCWERSRRRFGLLYWQVIKRLAVAATLCALFPLLATGATFRWVPSSNRIFVENGGSATLSDIKAALPNAPIDRVDPTNKIWLLRADLLVEDGSVLVLHGTGAGGDVNEFRLQSLNTVAAGSVVSVVADYGSLDISNTKILSWDSLSDGPDTEYQNFGRAHILVRSSLSTNGVTRESRMNITNSEIAYLGYDAPDSFGLAWKVGGTNPTPTNSIFDVVNVYGNVVNSHIHDNYYGIYTLGASGMLCSSNEINGNAQYGMNLQDHSDSLVIQGNNIHHNANHGLQASDGCDHLTLQGNVSQFNAKSGILLVHSSNDSVLVDNECSDNGENGLVLSASSRGIVRGNTLARNLRAGLQLDLGSADNRVENNQSSSNLHSGIILLKGSGTPEPGDDGRPKRNVFTGNLVQDNGSDPVNLTDGDDNIFATNSFRATRAKLRFKRGLRNLLDGNAIPTDLPIRTEGDTNVTASTFVRHQPFYRVELSTNGTLIAQDSLGQICQPNENTLLMEISTNGSSLSLTSVDIGGSTTVTARNFYASAAPGSAFLNNLVWAPATATRWSLVAGSAGQTLDFRLGDLVASTNYLVRKANVTLTNLNSDASGQLQFSDTAVSTNPVVYSVEIANPNATTISYSAAFNRISVKGGVPATLSDIKTALPAAPLDLVDATNKVWLLRSVLQVQDGGTLVLHGSGAGGDVNELRLLSLDTGATGSVVSVTADWGTLDIDSTKITSWNTDTGGPDTNHLAFGRAYLRVRSSLSTNGVTPLESRMDIRNSEIAYLGYNASDAYGLVWKVGGANPTPTNSIYDLVNVYGNVGNSHIHDNYIGAYTFGAFGMHWVTNEVDHNEQYGLDLQSDSDELELQGNNLHHNGNHGLLASARCDHLKIEGNLCWSNLQSGLVLDRSSDDALIQDNQCFDNADSGIVLSASMRTAIRNNALSGNLEAGLRLSLGSADNVIENNQSVSNVLYGIQSQQGSGTPNAGDDGRPKRNVFTGNLIQGNGVEPVRLADSDDNIFTSNTFSDTSGKLRFQRGLRNQLDGNILPATLAVRTEGDANALASTYVRNQTLLKIELGMNGSTVFEDAGGRICQPDEGAIATELSSNGSSLSLTSAEIGGSTMVIARNFRASAAPGTALLRHLIWTNDTNRRWSVTSDSPGQNLSFAIGDLNASSPYVVLKAGVVLTNLQSDASGQILFSDSATVTNAVVYSVEVPPSLPSLADQVIGELTTLVVTNSGTAPNTPASLLSYALISSPINAVISADGVITWTPTEAQGPSTNIFTTSVTVAGASPLSATNTFTVVVNEVNGAPILPIQSDVIVTAGSTLSVPNAASDADIPANRLTYTLLTAPAGAVIGADGVITWTPPPGEGPNTNVFTTVAMDDGVPPLSATNSFMVSVVTTNFPPILPAQVDLTIAELTQMVVTNTASDPVLPANILSYALQSAPSNAVISANGIITWTPTEAQGPGTNIFITVVSDNGVPPLSASNSFTVLVREINTAPELPAQADRTIGELTTLVVNNTATDPDIPSGLLQYALVTAPGNASISTNGMITWTPSESQALSTNLFTTVVTDNGAPPLSVTNSFTVFVIEVPSTLDPKLPPGGNFDLTHWRLTLPDATASDISTAELIAGFSDPPYFYTDEDGAMKFWCPVTGGTTQGSEFPRSELRELLDPNDYSVNWTGYGGHRLDAQCKVTQIPDRKRVIIGQIHSYTVATFPLLKLEFVDGAVEAKVKLSPNDPTNEMKYTFGNIGLGQLISYRLQLVDGIVSMTVNGINHYFNIFESDPAWTNQTFYFKAGNYCQDNDGPATEGSAVSFYQLNVSHSFTPNTPPSLAALPDLTVAELTPLVVTNTATDADMTPNVLTYALVSGPGNAVISDDGIISWTPTEEQGPSTNVFTTVVTDDGYLPLSATNSFVVIVTEANSAPTLPGQVDLTVPELTTLVVTNTAGDPDLPANRLSYVLQSGPDNAVLSAEGVITWTPTEAQGPSTNVFTTVATDDGSPPLSVTNTFVVIVTEANSAPTLPAQIDVALEASSKLQITNTATDVDVPANLLTYTLLSAPRNASISAEGIISWTPEPGPTASTNVFTTVVTDNGLPPLSTTNSFTVFVLEPQPTQPVVVQIQAGAGNGLVLSWSSPASNWVLQERTTLEAGDWADSILSVQILSEQQYQVVVPTASRSSFFRLIQR
jgi:parallel beta-helix repeat protein